MLQPERYFFVREQGKELLRKGSCFPLAVSCVRSFLLSYRGLRLSSLELNSGVLQFEHIDIDCHDTDEMDSRNCVKPKSSATILTCPFIHGQVDF